MIQLKVPFDEALRLIRNVHHDKCHNAIERQWLRDPGGSIRGRSICWLDCWARSGMGSAEAAGDARLAFDQIFDKPHDWFAGRVPHEVSREIRYMGAGDSERLRRYLV